MNTFPKLWSWRLNSKIDFLIPNFMKIISILWNIDTPRMGFIKLQRIVVLKTKYENVILSELHKYIEKSCSQYKNQ